MKNRLRRYGSKMPRKWRKSKPLRAAFGAASLVLPIVVVASSAASAGVNLVVNPNMDQMAGNFPLCYGKYGSGNNTYSIGTTTKAHSGNRAIQVTISKRSSGARTVLTMENTSCAPWVTPGHQYDLGVWYMSSTPDAEMVLYRHDVKSGWQYWTDLKTLPTAGSYSYASVRTPQVPANTDQIAWGVSVYGKGTVITDDYSTVDATVKASAAACSAGAACTRGAWQVMPFSGQVRAMHAVLLYNGKVLLVAGSGNDISEFNAGTFKTAVYNPANGTVTQIPTPADLFCSGHVQLPDGKVLVLGGNASYPTATHGYEGLQTSYIFNPVTDRYQKINNLIGGHWYPSATELGNGDVISFGGLDASSGGSVTMEYFKYNPSAPNGVGNWLSLSQTNQDFVGWGLYPAMILMQNGELFYSGSHVFGNNETPFGTVGTARGAGGAGIIGNVLNVAKPGTAALSLQTVTGLQDTPGGPPGTDMTDQSMSVLLPPAQSQKVLLAGGGNILFTKPATRLTDLINLSDPATAHYTPGPPLLRGPEINEQGKQTAKIEPASDGKMYVSLVILPNGQVLETGGGLLDRQAPYIKEASMYNPSTSKFTGMAPDPQPRGYHSTALLLPDGRVMTYGDNPGDGTFNEKISIYSPPYLFHGPRPQITSVASPTAWHYGKMYNIRTNQKIVSAELIRPAAVTHQSDPNQRYVALPLSVHGSTIGLNVTSNPNMAPPGWYMLFVNNANGVPSVAKWIHLS